MYCLYYAVPSSNMFASAWEAPPIANLDDLPGKLELLRSPDDVVSVMVTADGIRVQFWLADRDKISVVIDVSTKACGYTKVYPKARINEFLSEFSEVVADPESAGFSCEDWKEYR
jgi:hypothetical protein